METTIQLQPESILEQDSLLLASLILLNVSRIVRDIQTLVAVLLRYAPIGLSLTNSLIGLIVRDSLDEN